MAEYSRFATGSYTVPTGVTKPIYLPFQPTRVRLLNFTSYSTSTQHLVTDVDWFSGMGQGTAAMKFKGASSTYYLDADTVATNGISTFSAGLSLQYGPLVVLGASGAITQSATAPQITTVAAHGLATGDIVIFDNLYQTTSTGMQQMAGIPFVVTVSTAYVFTINFNNNGGNYTALDGSMGTLATNAGFRKVLNPFLYAPGESVIWAVTTGSTTTVKTTAPHNLVVGQEIAFRVSPQWGTVELNSLPNSIIPGSPIYGYVTSVTNSLTFVCSINSSSFTAFTTNVPFASYVGLTPAQVIAVGDVNTGGVAYSGGALYPSPVVNGVSTINGPAISGAFVNNTRQGFVVGNGVGVIDSSAVMGGVAGNTMFWEAWIPDLSV